MVENEIYVDRRADDEAIAAAVARLLGMAEDDVVVATDLDLVGDLEEGKALIVIDPQTDFPVRHVDIFPRRPNASDDAFVAQRLSDDLGVRTYAWRPEGALALSEFDLGTWRRDLAPSEDGGLPPASAFDD